MQRQEENKMGLFDLRLSRLIDYDPEPDTIFSFGLSDLCPKCGKKLCSRFKNYCSNCGTKINAEDKKNETQ